MLTEHPDATCPECDGSLLYRFSAGVGGWRVVFCCARACGFSDCGGEIRREEIGHRDERHDRAVAIGNTIG